MTHKGPFFSDYEKVQIGAMLSHMARLDERVEKLEDMVWRLRRAEYIRSEKEKKK